MSLKGAFSTEVKDNVLRVVASESTEVTRKRLIAKLAEDGFKPFGSAGQELVHKAEAKLYSDEGKIVELPLEAGYCVMIVSGYYDIYYWKFTETIEEAKEGCIDYLKWASFGAMVYITQNLHCFAKTFSKDTTETVSGEELKKIKGY